MARFSPTRLMLARARRRLTQAALADRCGLSRRILVAYERGTTQPTDDNLAALAQTLDFPASFFTAEEIDHVRPEGVSFRSLSTMTARDRDAVLAAGTIATAFNSWLTDRFHLPEADVLDLPDHEAELAAGALRAAWGIGAQPIESMVHLLEARGVRVFSLAEDCASVDGFSLWRNSTPFVFLNTLKSAERGRFDAAHELGHLVLHRHGEPQGREVERAANQFASAFLMPAAAVRASAPALLTLDAVVALKKRWRVSVAAMTYRLHTLGLLSEWAYTDMMREISVRGWRKNEPEGGPRETSQLLAKCLAALRQEHVALHDVAAALHVPHTELEALTFGLILMAAPRMTHAGEEAPSPQPQRFVPRLVR